MLNGRGVAAFDLVLVAPLFLLAILQPKDHRCRVGRITLGVGRVNRFGRTSRHEDLHRFVAVTKRATIKAFRNSRVSLSLSGL